MEKETVIFYGLPAYGHIHSNLYLTECLVQKGFWVVYYAMDTFREEIEAHGCEYRAYPIEQSAVDLSDGSKLIRLYRLLLKYTWDMLPGLLKEAKGEAESEKLCGIIFDSLAVWGRAACQILSVPSFSFYSIAAIDRLGG